MEKLPQNIRKNLYILILCGGTGPRLWPLSRADNPKQFLHLLSPHSLIKETINRSLKLTSPQNVFIVSNSRYQLKLQQEIGTKIPSTNILLEPEKKNTTMAILYGCSIIFRLNPQATIVSLPSDHFVSKLRHFQRDIYRCARYAQTLDSFFCLGVKPSFPNPAFGYITPGKKINNFFKVDSFQEKPDSKTAIKLIANHSFWNSGIYIFSLPTLEQELAKHQPNYSAIYHQLTSRLPKLKRLYHLAPDLPFDKAVSEKTQKMLVLPISFNWSDIGQWQSIFALSHKNQSQIAKLTPTVQFVSLKSQNCLVESTNRKLIGLIGVNNLAVIDTPDALLVCNFADSFLVRELVGQIVKSQKTSSYFLKSSNETA